MKDSVAGINYRFTDQNLLTGALTHRSLGVINNERLEFLGDSVLNLVISSRLYEDPPSRRIEPKTASSALAKTEALF